MKAASNLNAAGKNAEVWAAGLKYDANNIYLATTYSETLNMTTFVDYKINLLDDSDFTKAAKVSTDNIVAVGLNYQF